jgi:glutamine amidotransferase
VCRLLYVRSSRDFPIGDHLRALAHIAKHSKEYQGHGWGCAFLNDGEWRTYKNIRPIWEEEDLDRFGSSNLLIAHARSAFRNKGITIENNMPFRDDKYVFIFNGELRGVTIREKGRNGAEKIFNFVKRFDKGNMKAALERATGILGRRTEYIKAMNIIIADKEKAFVVSWLNEDPDYFTLRIKKGSELIICSEPYPGESDWADIPSRSVEVF